MLLSFFFLLFTNVVQCTNYENFKPDYGTFVAQNKKKMKHGKEQNLDEELLNLLNEWNKIESVPRKDITPTEKRVTFADEQVSATEKTKSKKSSSLQRFKINDDLWHEKLIRHQNILNYKSFEKESENVKRRSEAKKITNDNAGVYLSSQSISLSSQQNEREAPRNTCSCFSFLRSFFVRNHN